MPRFDTLIRIPAATPSRRNMLAGLASGLLAASFGIARQSAAETRKHGKRRQHRRNKDKDKRDKAKTRLDATCSGAGESGVGHPAGDARVAQSFRAIHNGPLAKATVPIMELSETGGDFVLSLSPADSSGLPTNEVLAEATSAVDPAFGEVVELAFAFADPFSVTAGANYALILTRLSGGDFLWRGDEGDLCGGNISVSLEPESPFLPVDVDIDLHFTTFVTS